MTSLKKTLLYLGLPVLAAIISIPFWPEQYGDSYSEQQRKLWNETIISVDDFRLYYGGDDPSIRQRNQINKKHSNNIRNLHAPNWNITLPESPDLSRLPLEGMTFDELLYTAEHQKNPDAWLLLLSSLCREGSSWSSHWEKPTNLEIQLMRKWGIKAHELNRAGSDFLLLAIDEREKTLNGLNEVDAELHLTKLNGYNEFKKLIDSGDFALYKALVAIWHGIHKTPFSAKLQATLEKRARQGDIIAQRQLGEFGFIRLGATLQTITQEKNASRSQWILWLSEKAEQWCPNLITIRKTTDSSPTRDKLDEYAAWLKRAADAGDLVAMDLWLQYGVEILKHYSKKDWEDILSFSTILLEAGYERTSEIEGEPVFRRSHEIIHRSYSPNSLNNLISSSENSLFKRGSRNRTARKIWYNKWENNTQEYNLDLLERARRQNPGLLLDFFDFFRYIKQIKDEQVKQCYVGIIREIANGGDPLFMISLACMMRQGMAEAEHPEETLRLLERAWPLCPIYHHLSGDLDLLSQVVVDHLMTIYLLEQPNPKNYQKAFKLAQQYNGLGTDDWSYAAYFYLSLMYQKGYGTPIDPEQEKHYYELFLEEMKLNTKDKEKRIKPLIEKFDYQMPK